MQSNMGKSKWARLSFLFLLKLSKLYSFHQLISSENKKNLDVVQQTTSSRYSNLISQQLYKLRAVNTHLRNAFNGMDVEWSDQGNKKQTFEVDNKLHLVYFFFYSDDSYYESGSGSGSGIDEDEEYGSGAGEIDASVPHLPQSPKTNTREEVIYEDYTEAPKFQPESTHINSIRPIYSSTEPTPSSVPSSQMTPLKAAIVYLLPIFIAWFGGLFSDLL